MATGSPTLFRDPLFMVGYHAGMAGFADIASPGASTADRDVEEILVAVAQMLSSGDLKPAWRAKLNTIQECLRVYGGPDRGVPWVTSVVHSQLKLDLHYVAGRASAAYEQKQPRTTAMTAELVTRLIACGINTAAAGNAVAAVPGNERSSGAIPKSLNMRLDPDSREVLLGMVSRDHAAGKFPDQEILRKLGCNERIIGYLRVVFDARPNPIKDADAGDKLGHTHPSTLSRQRRLFLPADVSEILIAQEPSRKMSFWKP